MSVNGNRIGGQYFSGKPVPLWAACFGWLVFLIMLAGFSIGGWCLVIFGLRSAPAVSGKKEKAEKCP